mgnify:CR=1 FL=1
MPTTEGRLATLEVDSHAPGSCPVAGEIAGRLRSIELWQARWQGASAAWGVVGGLIGSIIAGSVVGIIILILTTQGK